MVLNAICTRELQDKITLPHRAFKPTMVAGKAFKPEIGNGYFLSFPHHEPRTVEMFLKHYGNDHFLNKERNYERMSYLYNVFYGVDRYGTSPEFSSVDELSFFWGSCLNLEGKMLVDDLIDRCIKDHPDRKKGFDTMTRTREERKEMVEAADLGNFPK
jgi:hypothetical protein